MDMQEIERQFEILDKSTGMLVGNWQAQDAAIKALIASHPDPKQMQRAFELLRLHAQGVMEGMAMPEFAIDSFHSAADQYEQEIRERLVPPASPG